jgi:hypothetical protein
MDDENKVVTPAATTPVQNQAPAADANCGCGKKHGKKNKKAM